MDVGYPEAVLGTLAVVTVVGLAVAASTSAAAFGTFNPAWDGASDLRDRADDTGATAEIVQNASAYDRHPPNGTIAVVLSPDRAYDQDDAARVRRFVRGGGTLLVAEDFGNHSNPLLAAVGARARFDGSLLRDERYNHRSPAMPIARNATDHRYTEGVDALTLNHATAVAANGSSVLVRTSGYAYLDANRDGDLDDEEELGAYPVATIEPVGAGRVLALGDPSALINAMLERPGNRAFVDAAFAAHDHVLLDYSHTAGLPPLMAAVLALRRSAALAALAGAAVVGAVGLWERWPSLRSRWGGEADRSPLPGPDDLTEFLTRRHPDWDDDRVRRIVQGLITTRHQRRDDD